MPVQHKDKKFTSKLFRRRNFSQYNVACATFSIYKWRYNAKNNISQANVAVATISSDIIRKLLTIRCRGAQGARRAYRANVFLYQKSKIKGLNRKGLKVNVATATRYKVGVGKSLS